MAKHKNESTYISMDNSRISEKTFSVPLGFGGYLLTIVHVALRYNTSRNSNLKILRTGYRVIDFCFIALSRYRLVFYRVIALSTCVLSRCCVIALCAITR